MSKSVEDRVVKSVEFADAVVRLKREVVAAAVAVGKLGSDSCRRVQGLSNIGSVVNEKRVKNSTCVHSVGENVYALKHGSRIAR